jgi:lysophospholipase L1-like esterase
MTSACRSLALTIVLCILAPAECYPQAPERKLIAPSDRAFSYDGLIDASDPDAPVLIWEATRVAIDFQGTSLALRFGRKLGEVFLDVQVDSQSLVLRVKPGELTKIAWPGSLAPGGHHLTLYKRSEASAGTVVFLGVEVDADASVWRPAQGGSGLKMLFFGDSITAGACNEDGAADQWENRRTHDAALSYAALTANAFSADYRNISVSGIGISTGYYDVTFPEIWDRLYPRKNAPMADLASWRPDIIFFNFGENDSSFTHVHGQPFPSTFAERYLRLVADVRQAYPRAELVLLRGGMAGGATDPSLIAAWTETVRRVEAGDARASHYAFKHWTALHPRVADDRQMADELVQWLRGKAFASPPR